MDETGGWDPFGRSRGFARELGERVLQPISSKGPPILFLMISIKCEYSRVLDWLLVSEPGFLKALADFGRKSKFI